MKSILDPTFRYTSAVDTDIRKTFARFRRARRVAEVAHAAAAAEHETATAQLAPVLHNFAQRRAAKGST